MRRLSWSRPRSASLEGFAGWERGAGCTELPRPTLRVDGVELRGRGGSFEGWQVKCLSGTRVWIP